MSQEVAIEDIDNRITQLKRRFNMEWYNKDQLLEDLYILKENIYIIAKRNDNFKPYTNDYYNQINIIVDKLI